MRAIWTLAGKDLRLLVRDKAGFFFVFFFPLVYAVFFGVIFSGGGGDGGRAAIPLVVVDEAGTDAAARLVDALDKDAGVAVSRAARAEASDRVRRGDAVAYLVVPKGYEGMAPAIFAGKPWSFELGIDPSRKAEGGMLQGVLMRAAFADMPGDAFRNPIALERREVAVSRRGPNNSFAITFPQGILWGIMGCAAGFGVSLVVERTKGTLPRLAMSPLSRAHILAGKALACFLTVVGVAVALLLLGVVALGVRPGSLPLLALGIVCNGLGFVGIMMLLSVMGKTEQAAGGIGWAVLVTMAMIGGGMIPLFVMPSWMHGLASISPVKWGILAMEGAIWRGFTLTEMLLPCGILVTIGAACFTLGIRFFRWE